MSNKVKGSYNHTFGFLFTFRFDVYPILSQDQYIFIHDAILEALTCGVTEVRARDIPNHFQWLRDKDSYTNNIRLKDEYEVSLL